MSLTLPPPIAATIEGRPVLRYLPPHPKGIVYLFHGTGGSEQFATRVHSQRVLAALVAAGYGYAAAPSLDRTKLLRWDISSLDPKANPDVAYMLALHKDLIGRGDIGAATPVFTMGMSNGGAFANLFAAAAKAQGLPVAAVADYMGPFPEAMRGLLDHPRDLPATFIVLSENDGLVSTPRVGGIAAQLAKGGAVIESHLNTEHSVCAGTFALIPDLSAAERQILVDKTLPDAGLIDAEGRRLAFKDKPVIDPDAMQALYRRVPAGRQGRLIANELVVAWAGHEMRSEYAQRQVAFFDQVLAGVTAAK